MECSLCNEICNLPSDTKSSSKFAVVLTNGKVVCHQCEDVIGWADSSCMRSDGNYKVESKTKPTPNIDTKPKVEPIVDTTNKKTSVTMIRCTKCKSYFSGRVCTCGFKNPLYR